MRFQSARDIQHECDASRNDAPMIQAELDSPSRTARIPAGHYHLATPLRLLSGARLIADDHAFFHARGLSHALETSALLPCARDLSIRGGRWIGAGFRFSFVRGLRIAGVTFSDTPTALTMDHVDGYDFEDLALEGLNGGILVAGCCRHGNARGIDATRASLNGACLAFHSDDAVLPHGPIENSEFRDVVPESVRFESDGSTIRNILVNHGQEVLLPATSAPDFCSSRGHYDNIIVRGRSYSSAPNRHGGERFPSKVLLEPGEFFVTSAFGKRVHPVTGEVSSMHNGIDGALWDGRMLVETGICAWREGIVLVAEDGDGPAGTNVSIDHGDGLVSRYFHMERGSLRVTKGERVRERSLLGWMGRTGRSTGEHLHFQLEKEGVPVDPLSALRENSRRRFASF